MVHGNLIKRFPVTIADIYDAGYYFGPNLAYQKVKVNQFNPKQVGTIYVRILKIVLEFNNEVEIRVNIIFVN